MHKHTTVTLPYELLKWVQKEENEDINLSGFLAKHLREEKKRREL